MLNVLLACPPVFDRFLCLYLSLFISLFVCLFISSFVSLLARLRENGWTDLHETSREGVEWPWDDVIQFLVNSEKLRDAAMLIFFVSNITSKPLNQFAWNFQGMCGVTMGWPDYIFGQFRETARCRDPQHGERGLLCFRTAACLFLAHIIWFMLCATST